MMNKFPLLFLFFFLSFSFAIGQGTWTQKANVPGLGRGDAFSFSIGRKGYFACGYDSSGHLKNDLWEWDQLTNVWTQKASLPAIARRGGGAFSIGTKGYIIGGIDSIGLFNLRDVWEWNSANNTWSQKGDFPGHAACWTVAFSIGSKGYIGTGENSGGTKGFYEYDPSTDTWTQKADFGGLARYDDQGFSVGSKGYIGGGYDDVEPWYYIDIWEYNPDNNTWTQKANMPKLRCNGVGFSLCGKGYLFSGFNPNTGDLNDLFEWDQSTDTWIQKAFLPASARMCPIVFTIGNKGYIGMGFSQPIHWLNDFWEYTPDTLCIDTVTPPPDTIASPSINNIIFIPNIFSPNNDGANDIFRLQGKNISQLDIKVYDRWGNIVFETQDKNEAWTGHYNSKDCPEGVYYYLANITFTNGETTMKKGNVTLIR
jgi:gliding motility-associated-like protein